MKLNVCLPSVVENMSILKENENRRFSLHTQEMSIKLQMVTCHLREISHLKKVFLNTIRHFKSLISYYYYIIFYCRDYLLSWKCMRECTQRTWACMNAEFIAAS